MATRSKEENLQCLNCPMCLGVIRNATILSCGHSFCRGCLEAYDNQHKDLNHIVCPVCRKLTKLDQERVAGLTPNFLAKGVEDILIADVIAKCQEDDLSSTFCPLHSHVYKDIYCQPCSEFICITCYIDSHQGHKYKKQEELEKELKTKRDALLEKSMTRKTHIEKCLSEAALQREVMNSHLGGLEREVRDAFVSKVATLQQNEEELLEKIKKIRKDLDKQLEGCICRCTEVIGRISNSAKLLTHHASKSLDHDMIKADQLRCADLEDSLMEVTDEESTTRVEEITRSLQFCPDGDELLALGSLNVSNNDTESNISTDDARVSEGAEVPSASSMESGNATQHAKTTRKKRWTNRRKKLAKANRNAIGTPEVVLNNSLSILRARAFPRNDGVSGLAAVSEDAVVIAYAKDRAGCDRFTLSGDESPYLGSEVGDVYDVAFLSDGRTVVSNHGGELFVYNTVSGRVMSYACKEGYSRVCTDQHDNIYAVNFKPEICIFHGSNPNPQKVVPTGNIRPQHICVTKTGIMITSNTMFMPIAVTVFDQEGRVGTSIVATNRNDFVYATVDSLDRVLVATVGSWSDLMGLTRYRLQGFQPVEEVRFQFLRMPGQNSFGTSGTTFRIVSLSPNMIAVVFQNCLSFIQLGM